jgi:hypothetical protein
MKLLILITLLTLTGCAHTVLIDKETCKDVGSHFAECEEVK